MADTNVRESLKAFLAEFPGEEALAAKRFAEEKSVTDVKLELALRDKEALAAAKVTIETLTKERDEAVEALAALRALEAEAGSPGVGFNGQVRQAGEQLAPALPKTPKEAWERSVRLQREFPTLSTYEALCRREGFDPQEAAK